VSEGVGEFVGWIHGCLYTSPVCCIVDAVVFFVDGRNCHMEY